MRGSLRARRKPKPKEAEVVPIDEWAVSIVVVEGTPMKLLGSDRVEAIRQMTEKGIPFREQARRLRSTQDAIEHVAAYYGFKIGSLRPRWAERKWPDVR